MFRTVAAAVDGAADTAAAAVNGGGKGGAHDGSARHLRATVSTVWARDADLHAKVEEHEQKVCVCVGGGGA